MVVGIWEERVGGGLDGGRVKGWNWKVVVSLQRLNVGIARMEPMQVGVWSGTLLKMLC